jgi:hypothetical protein
MLPEICSGHRSTPFPVAGGRSGIEAGRSACRWFGYSGHLPEFAGGPVAGLPFGPRLQRDAAPRIVLPAVTPVSPAVQGASLGVIAWRVQVCRRSLHSVGCRWRAVPPGVGYGWMVFVVCCPFGRAPTGRNYQRSALVSTDALRYDVSAVRFGHRRRTPCAFLPVLCG